MANPLFDDYTLGLAATSYASGISTNDPNIEAVKEFHNLDSGDVFRALGSDGIAEQYRIRSAFDKASKPIRARSAGEAFEDSALAVKQGLITGAQGAAGLLEVIGRLPVGPLKALDDASRGVSSVLNYFKGESDNPNRDKLLSEHFGSTIDYFEGIKSDTIKQRKTRAEDEYNLLQSQRGEENVVQKFLGEVYDSALTTGTDLPLAADIGFQALGSSVGPGGVGGAVARRIPGVVGQKAALGASALTEGIVVEGGVSASEAYSQVTRTPLEELEANSPEYRELVASGVPPKIAKEKIANDISREILLKVGAASSAVAAVGPNIESQLFSKTLRDAADNTPGIKGSIIAQTVGEIGEETVQNTLQSILSKQELQRADDTIDVLDGAGKAAFEGAIGGGSLSAIRNSPRAAGKVTTAAVVGAGRATGYVRGKVAEVAENLAESRTGDTTIPNAAEDSEVKEPTIVDKVKEKVTKVVKEVAEEISKNDPQDTKKPKKTEKPKKDSEKINKPEPEVETPPTPTKEEKRNKAIIVEAQKTYNKYKAVFKDPAGTLDRVKPEAKARIKKDTQGITDIAQNYEAYIVNNFGDRSTKSPEIQENLKKAETFINSLPVKRFKEARNLLDLETDESIKDILKVYNESNPGNANISKVQRESLIDGFNYYDDKTQQTVRLYGLLEYGRALELARKTDNKHTYIGDKVVPVRDVLAQLSIFNRSQQSKARAAIRSVNEGNIDVKYNDNIDPIRINDNAESRELGENILKEANAINEFINTLRRKVPGNEDKDYKTIPLVLPPQPEKVSEVGAQVPQEQVAPTSSPDKELEALNKKFDKEIDTAIKEGAKPIVRPKASIKLSGEGVFNLESTDKETQDAFKKYTRNLKVNDKILETFKNSKPDYKGVLYRGSYGYRAIPADAKVGDTVTLDKTSSFSYDLNAAKAYSGRDYDRKFKTLIRVSNGTGYDISTIDGEARGEGEILTPPNTVLRIDKLHRAAEGDEFTLHVDATQIEVNNLTTKEPEGVRVVRAQQDVDIAEFKIDAKTEERIQSNAFETALTAEEGLTRGFIESLSTLPRRAEDSTSLLQQFYNFRRDPLSSKEFKSTIRDKSSKIDGVVASNIINASDAFVERVAKAMNKSLNTNSVRGKTILSRFFGLVDKGHEGVVANGMGSMAFIEQTEKGDYVYKDSLLYPSLLGAYDWVLNTGPQTIFKEDIVANIFNIREDQVANVHLEALQFGITRKIAIEGLTRALRGYVQLQDNKDRKRKDSLSIIGDYAAEIYSNMLEEGILEEKGFEMPVYDDEGERLLSKDGKAVSSEVFTVKVQSDDLAAFIKNSIGGDNVRKMSKLFNTNYKPAFSIGEKIKREELDRYQQGTRVKLSESELDAVEKASNAAQYYNQGFGNFILNLPTGVLEKVLGEQEIRESTNVSYATNVRGTNLTIKTLVGLARDLKTAVEDYRADANSLGKALDIQEIPVYFKAREIKSGRITQGSWGPIPNKVVRELFKGKNTVINLNNKQDEKAFWLSIAVGLDIKIKNLPAEDIEQNIKNVAINEIEGTYAKSVVAIKDWLNTVDGVATEKVPESVSNVLLEDLGLINRDRKNAIPSTPELREIHTVFAYANYLRAKENGTLDKLEHTLPIEVDGITNGTINQLMYLLPAIGEAVKEGNLGALRKNLELVAKGGIFFPELGKDFKTLNEAAEVDIYEYSAKHVENDLNNVNDWAHDPEAVKATARILSALGIISSISDNNSTSYSVPRKVTKPPTTKVGYGSGAGSVSTGFSGDVLKDIYKAINQEMIDINNGLEDSRIWYDGIQDDFDTAFGKGVDTVRLFNSDRITRYAANFSFTEQQKRHFALSQGSQDTKYSISRDGPTGVGSILFDSTQPIIGNLSKTTEVLLDSYLMRAKAASEHLQSLVDTYKKGGVNEDKELSKAEEDKLMDKTMDDYGLNIVTPFGTFNPASKLKRVTNSTMSNQIETIRAKLSEPGINPNPGVAALPLLIIGLGDALIVKGVFESIIGDVYTQFYDAFDLTADGSVFKKVKDINGVLAKAYTEVNIPRYFLDGHEKATKAGLLEGQNIDKFGGGKKYTLTPEMVQASLGNLADFTEIANAALKETKFNVQHYNVSYPEATFTNEGNGKSNFGFEEEVSDSESQKIETLTVSASTLVENIKTRLKAARKTNEYSASQAAIYESAFKVMTQQNIDFEVIFGSKNNLPADLAPEDKRAAIDIVNNKIYIKSNANFSEELFESFFSTLDDSLIHEIIHGLTVSTMYKYYDGQAISDDSKEAINRLEKLSARFKQYNPGKGDLTSTQRDLVVRLQDILNGVSRDELIEETEDNQGSAFKKAEVLSEFVAHFLANKEIVGIGKRLSVPEELKRITKRIFESIRNLWGIRTKNESLFEAIKFEFDIIIKEKQSTRSNKKTLAEAVQRENVSPFIFNTAYIGKSRKVLFDNANDKLKTVFSTYWARTYNSELTPESNQAIGIKEGKTAKKQLTKQATEALNKYTSAGFSINSAQDKKIFKVMHMLYNSGIGDKTPSLTRVVSVFNHIASEIKLKDLGKKRFDAVFKAQGNDVVAGFLALSQSSAEFREVLDTIELPPELKVAERTADGYISYVFNKILNTMFNLMHGNPTKGAEANTDILDNLVESLIKVSDPHVVNRVSRYPNQALDFVDEKVGAALEGIGEISRAIASGLDITAENVEKMFISTESNLVRGLYREISGSNENIEPILSLVRKATSAIQKARQEDLVQIPKALEKLFKKGVTQDQKVSMYEVMVKSDLINYGTFDEVVNTINDDTALNSEILNLTRSVNAVSTLYLTKIEQLAKHMVDGTVGPNLLRNANAISRLFGDHRIAGSQALALVNSNPSLVSNIDKLVSLLALKGKAGDLDVMRELIQKDKKATKVTFEAARRLYREEGRKRNINEVDLVTYNQTKGFGYQDSNNGQHIIMAPLSNEEHLSTLGYEILRSYYDPVERREYAEFYADRSQHGPFIEGAMQIVNTGNIHGVDSRTGLNTSNHAVTGSIITPRDGRYIQAMFRSNANTSIDYVTTYRPDGSVKNYQRIIDPNKLTTTQREKYNTVVVQSDMLKILGGWRGRLKEESVGEAYNQELVDKLVEHWDSAEDKSLFVNLADHRITDATYQDIYEKIPYKTKEYILSKFGKNKFYVRKDLIDNALGYALPTLVDPFTRISRLSPEAQKLLRSAATIILGKNAYKHLTNVNNVTIGLVKHTKETVIIRSLIVPYLNILSDFVHLLSNGVTPKEIYENSKRVLVELDYYTKRTLEETELKLKIQSQRGSKRSATNARIKALQDSYTKLSIYPLIREGHFSTITEGLSETDRLVVGGKVSEYLGKLYDDLPPAIQETGRQLVIARDTAMFKGMTRTIQYSTIISKSIYFESILKKGKTEAEALAAVAEEFVNYDLLPGRIRSFGDAFGLTWFFNYKLRILKIARNLAVNHPVRAFIYSVLLPYASIVDAGGPIADNVLSVIADGRGDDAVGFWRVLRGITLHPLGQIFELTQ